jgi:hypothetical protein
MERRAATNPIPERDAFFEQSAAYSAVERVRGAVRGRCGGCAAAVPGIRAAVRPFPGEKVMPAMPGFGTAGIRAAALCPVR